MIYVAAPYSDTYRSVVEERFNTTEKIVASMISAGLPVISPVIHCHEMARNYNFPIEFEFWKTYCLDILRASDILYVLMLDGWRESLGVQAEIEFAKKNGIVVMYFDANGALISDFYKEIINIQ